MQRQDYTIGRAVHPLQRRRSGRGAIPQGSAAMNAEICDPIGSRHRALLIAYRVID